MDFVRPSLAVLLCGGALALGGCTRTSDGSLEVANAPAMMPAFIPGAESNRRESRVAVADYRRAPASSNWGLQRKAAQAEAWKPAPRVATPRPSVGAVASTLSCRNVTDPGGRVRVVCQ
ncbi:MAG TPA: hypothetical protein VMF90_00800 [Rhizobiaceae bacterium]|nr:hypothetical protein [Rhizobiaceae bacterium]